MNSRPGRWVLMCALACMLVSVIAHQNMVRRGWDSDQAKVGVPIAGYSSDINDNYLYFSLIKRGAGACRSPADDQDVDGSGNPLACTYLPAIVVDHFLYQTIKALTPDRVTALGGLLIAQTGLLALAALLFIQRVLQRRFGFLAALAVAGAVVFLSDAFSWSFRFRTLYTNLPNIWLYEANVVRLVSPTVYWTLGLFALVALLGLMKKPVAWRYAIAGALLALSATSSIAVGATIGAGVGLALVTVLVLQRRLDLQLLFAAAMLLVGLVWQEWFFSRFYSTELGSQLGHGSFIGVHFDPAYLVLLVPVFVGRIGREAGYSQILLKALLAGSALVGTFSESVELGDRLWLRGATMIAFVLTIAWAITTIVWLWQLLQSGRSRPAMARGIPIRQAAVVAASLVLILALVGFSAWVRPYDPQRWYGVVGRDRLAAIEWIATHTQPGDVVASGNIDDTNLIEFYSDATAFVGLYGMSALSFDELIRRYLFVADLLQNSDQAFGRLQTATQAELTEFFGSLDGAPIAPYDQDKYQVVGFYELLVYHSYNAAVRGLFSNGAVDPAFVDRLDRLRSEAAARRYTFNYLILRVTDHLRAPQDFRELFRNSSYIIYAPERTDRAVSQ